MSDTSKQTRPILNVMLMGLRGSGKSTLGRGLAMALDRTFVDLDDMTVMRLGANSVTEIWKQGGESRFRKAETGALRAALAQGPTSTRGGRAGQVIALGGGTPTAPGAGDILRSALNEGDVAIYIRATPTTLRARLEESDVSDRPNLTGGEGEGGEDGVLDEIETVFEQRDELYRELATHVVDVDGLSESTVIDRLRTIIAQSD